MASQFPHSCDLDYCTIVILITKNSNEMQKAQSSKQLMVKDGQ
jgi:hypothetical protein